MKGLFVRYTVVLENEADGGSVADRLPTRSPLPPRREARATEAPANIPGDRALREDAELVAVEAALLVSGPDRGKLFAALTLAVMKSNSSIHSAT